MNEKVTALGSALAARGHRLTRARLAILETLVGTGGHVTADELAERVRVDYPHVGRMTVYRTLDLLTELALVRPIYQGTGAAHYVLMLDGHHHHLICLGCGAVIEFEECMAGRLEALVAERFQFAITGHLLEFYGRCEACEAQA